MELADTEAKGAFAAMKTLRATPESAVSILRQRLPPAAVPDAKRVQRGIAELDSDSFAVRERATKQLAELQEVIEQLLRQAIRGRPSLELRRRVEGLLENLSAESLERLRMSRALEVLEWLDTPEARRLLDELAHGAPSAWLTREATAALERRTAHY